MSKAENISILHEVARNRQVSPSMLNTLEHIISGESANWQADSKNPKSSARGLFQFIDSTWLGMLKKEGATFGLGKYAPHIRMTRDGWTIDDPALRTEALGLRNDAKISCEMGIALTRDNVASLSRALGREPSSGEIYLAHFLGDRKAIEVLKHPDPNTKIVNIFTPEVMRQNSDVHLKHRGKKTYFGDFTIADLQVWAAGKMDQPLTYEQLSEENRQRLWRQKHPRALKPGEKDDYSDMVESFGDLVAGIFQAIGIVISSAISAIGSIFTSDDNRMTPPLPTPALAQHGVATTPPRG